MTIIKALSRTRGVVADVQIANDRAHISRGLSRRLLADLQTFGS